MAFDVDEGTVSHDVYDFHTVHGIWILSFLCVEGAGVLGFPGHYFSVSAVNGRHHYVRSSAHWCACVVGTNESTERRFISWLAPRASPGFASPDRQWFPAARTHVRHPHSLLRSPKMMGRWAGRGHCMGWGIFCPPVERV